MSQAVNPITVEVVRNGLAHIANEMATVLRKTSYNMMIYEVRDYCVGIVDPEGNILSQNFGALPIFLADLGPAILDGVRMHGRDGFQPGDVLLMNHPYVCGQHLNNVVVYTPFFHHGELVAFLAVRAHWIDIGGTRVGFRLQRDEGNLRGRVAVSFAQALSRRSAESGSFFRSSLITCALPSPVSVICARRSPPAGSAIAGYGDLVGRYGSRFFCKRVRSSGVNRKRWRGKRSRRIKPGKYQAEALFDSDGVDLGRPVPLKVRVEVAGSEMTIDFSEISDQVQGSINSGESGAVAAARVAFKSLIVPFSPIDEGCFRPLKIVIPEPEKFSAPCRQRRWAIGAAPCRRSSI